jgi:hypothetical protein
MTPRGARLLDDPNALKRAMVVSLLQLYVVGHWRDGRELKAAELLYIRRLALRLVRDVFPVPERDR